VRGPPTHDLSFVWDVEQISASPLSVPSTSSFGPYLKVPSLSTIGVNRSNPDAWRLVMSSSRPAIARGRFEFHTRAPTPLR
jgi:hypothetical protein